MFAKIIAHIIFGMLVSALRSVLEQSPTFRAILLIAIGIFMLGNGLRLLKLHPIFRYFIIKPPSFLTRYIWRKSKNGVTW